MIDLEGDPQEVPRIERSDQVDPGKVYVLVEVEGEGVPQLKDGDRVVLETEGGGRRELKTVAKASGPMEDGTYLNDVDFVALGGEVDKPTLRRYRRFKDAWKKARSKKGTLLLTTTGLGLLVVAAGLWFAIVAESGTSTAAVTERAQSLLQWAAAPAGAAAGGVAASREARAQQCLIAMRGGEAEVERVHGVECKTESPSFFHDKESAGLVSAGLGALTALFGLLALGAKFGFGQEP